MRQVHNRDFINIAFIILKDFFIVIFMVFLIYFLKNLLVILTIPDDNIFSEILNFMHQIHFVIFFIVLSISDTFKYLKSK